MTRLTRYWHHASSLASPVVVEPHGPAIPHHGLCHHFSNEDCNDKGRQYGSAC